jgi:VanZ family protein
VSERGPTLAALRRTGALLQRIARPLAPLLVVAWVAFIWWLSARPAGQPSSSLFRHWLWNSAHAPLFGLLALWSVLVLPRAAGWPKLERGSIALVMLFVFAVAVLDELHQSYTPGRDMSPLDVLTDLIGAGCTLAVIAYLGDERAYERGLWQRLISGLLLCSGAGALAAFA